MNLINSKNWFDQHRNLIRNMEISIEEKNKSEMFHKIGTLQDYKVPSRKKPSLEHKTKQVSSMYYNHQSKLFYFLEI